MDAQRDLRERAVRSELRLYYLLAGAYFFAFGMQMVLFPSLVTFFLAAPAKLVGLAQMSISAPMFCLLLFGGVVAERAQPGPALALLHGAMAVATLALAALIGEGLLTYPGLIAYAIAVGACAALIVPVRDASLNGVLAREALRGRHTPLARAAAMTTAVQIGAQIAGIVVARFAGHSPAPFLALQALVLGLGGAVALALRAPKPTGHERSPLSALRDVRHGLAYAFKSPIMSPMLISAAYAGLFIVGSFQVLFPLLIRDVYGGAEAAQAQNLSLLYATFWGASFVSAAALSRLPALKHPGRALLCAHLIGAVVLITLAIDKPFWALALIVGFWGLATGVNISMSRTIVQGATEPRFLGRVLAVYSMCLLGGAPVGSLLVGFASEHLGPRLGALVPGVGMLVSATLLAALTPLWRFAPQAASETAKA
ncbi:MAG TPA: MFS transporter [Caulobacterales bacterium]|nr:MFS transporter [Caulobacterales bacterium]